jgi:predicted DNA-binding transcriptional regulator AlpA
MDTKLLELAFLKLSEDLMKALTRIETLEGEVKILKQSNQNSSIEIKTVESDELLNTKDVMLKLGICYNSLAKLIKDGLIKPIRINQRRIRFTKSSILKYIQLNS